MANITIYLNEDYKKDDGTCAVYLVTHIKSKKIRINTKVSLHPDYFDPISKKIVGNIKDVKDARLIIEQCRSRMNEIFVSYRLSHKELTPDIFRKEYEDPTSYSDFYQFMNRLMTSKKKENAENTIKTHQTLLNKLQEFRPSLMFSDINDDFIVDFKYHLKTKLKNNMNTTTKMLRIFRIYINAAKRKGLIEKSPFQDVKIKSIEAYREFLNPDELERLMTIYQGTDLPENYRDTLRAFLFSCFTGLRISDAKEIKMENVQNNTLVFIPVKSQGIEKTVRVPLTKPALMLIKDAAPLRLYGKIFKMETDQSVNRKLKKIIKFAEMEKEITFHCGRHTFATIFLRKGGKLHILQKLLGHYSIQDTMKYVHILQDDTEDQMRLFNAFMISDSFDQLVAINNLINWENLSDLLTKSRGTIKPDYFSEHQTQVVELLGLINTWYEKNYKKV